MVDTWFGRLLNTVDQLGLRDNTLVLFFSDHGTNFGDNPDKIMGKPADYMYPGTMDIPLLMRHPAGLGAGQVRDELVYTLDVPATILDAARQHSAGPVEGQSLLPLLEDAGGFNRREYLTCRYGNSVWYRDDRNWFFDSVDWQSPPPGASSSGRRQPVTRLFDLKSDPDCRVNIAGHSPERVALARERILADAGGRLNYYERHDSTDALGRPQFSSR